jgi:ubiquinone/menaquinone biosynthesis C-methylase UbiE
MDERKKHWEAVYETRKPNEVSWTQDVPKTSLDFIRGLNLDKSAGIIDIGGGDGKLVDFLLNEGFENITVLDISEKALERAKKRLGADAKKVKWIVADVTRFHPDFTYEVWHDRAAFHFLTAPEHIQAYVDTVQKAVGKYLIIATFSEKGPKKCSGLEIKQYTKERLQREFYDEFEMIRCLNEDHVTPFKTIQNFLFCVFERRRESRESSNDGLWVG